MACMKNNSRVVSPKSHKHYHEDYLEAFETGSRLSSLYVVILVDVYNWSFRNMSRKKHKLKPK